MVPLGAAHESPYIKTELQEPHPEEALQEDKAQGAWSWGRLNQDSKEKALFLPGGGKERDVKRSALLGSSCEERWRLTAEVGQGRGPCHGQERCLGVCSLASWRPFWHSLCLDGVSGWVGIFQA